MPSFTFPVRTPAHLHSFDRGYTDMKLRLLFFGLATAACVTAVMVNAPRATLAGSPAAATNPTAALERLDALTRGRLTVTQHPRTSLARFVGTDRAHAIDVAPLANASATPETVARAFLAEYGAPFGVRDAAAELQVMRERTVDGDRSFVRFQQLHRGIPVVGGELIVQTLPGNKVVAATGQLAPGLDVDVTPRISAEEAATVARKATARAEGVDEAALVAGPAELWIYNPTLLKPDLNLNALVWRLEVRATDLAPIRDLVLVDAVRGSVALRFNQIAHGRNRIIYDNSNNPGAGLPGTGPFRTEGQGPSGRTEVDRAYDYAGDTYNFFFNQHGRDSIDGAGMALINTVRYCPASGSCPYANAFWNGTQMVYGDGYAGADDVVAHELTHGVTERESNLFYYYQSGAINEALSDIWGEFVDLTNGRGNDSAGVRWLMGEDIPGGAIRSMSNPPAFSDPDRMQSGLYACDLGETDSGGVHTNSGVLNKAAALLVDGGSFNGKTVTSIGVNKTAKIMYEMAAYFLTSASDYQVVYDTLQAACTNLIGVGGINASDCQQVKNAIDATQMNLQPTACAAPEAPVCPAGQFPAVIFQDNIENAASGLWTKQNIVGATNVWSYPQTPNPVNFDVRYATSGNNSMWGYNSGSLRDSAIRMSASRAIPAGAFLRFNHAFGFEDDGGGAYDGGVVEYSTDGGGSWNDAGGLFDSNGYTGSIFNGYDNPLRGRSAFVRESNGYISSRANLNPLAGQNVMFRFRIGTDTGYDDYGWFVDDVQIYTCKTPTRTIRLPIIRRK